jgi:hypothetical protein
VISEDISGRIGGGVLNIKVPVEVYYPVEEESITKRFDVSLNRLADQTARTLNDAPREWTIGGAHNWDRESIYRRIWKPSQPILHLAVMIANVFEEILDSLDPTIEDLLDGDWVPRAVQFAEVLRRKFIECPRYQGFQDDNTIQVRLSQTE